MLPYQKLCTLIFAFLFYSLPYFFNVAQDLVNGFHNSLMGHNTILNMLSSRPHNTVPTGIHYRNHRTIQSAIKSSSKIDSPGSKDSNGRAACPAGPAREA